MTIQPNIAGKRPPLVPGLPLLGNSLGLLRDPTRFFVQAYRKFGPVFRVRIPTAPGGELVVMAGPEANVFASREGEKYFTTRQYFKHLVRETSTPHYLCALDGDQHTHFRKMLKPAFSRELLTPYVEPMINMVQTSARSWPLDEPISVMEKLQRLTIEQLTLVASNCPIDDSQFHDLNSYANTFVGAGVALRPPQLFYLPAYQASKHRFETYLKTLIQWHEKNQPGDHRQPDLVDVVLNAHYADGQTFDEADRLAHAHLPYVNGLVYAGRVCGYLLYALLKHPDLLARAVEEIDAAFAEGTPDVNMLHQMEFLHNSLQESYRLFPIAGAAPRYAARPFEYAGYEIQEGQTVFIAITVPHFLEEIYAEPYTFDPDRFAAPRQEHKAPGAFMPYGVGSHTCISIGLVETVAMTTMIGLLRALRVELTPPGYTLRTTINPVPGPESHFAFRIVEQRSDSLPVPRPLFRRRGSVERLNDVADSLISRWMEKAEKRAYPAGAEVIRQGDEADAFYIILGGEVEVYRTDQDGRQRLLNRLGQGSYFGEIGLIHKQKRTATVRASEEGVQLLVIEYETFLDFIAEGNLTSREICQLALLRADLLQ
jgi:cytochrome P450